MIKNALILAAGKGSRMWPLSENIPKPLLPLGGLPIIERQIQELVKVGVEDLYILIGYRMKEISDYLDTRKLNVNINYIFQEQQNGTLCVSDSMKPLSWMVSLEASTITEYTPDKKQNHTRPLELAVDRSS